ncbi:MAG TPA: hypothetical protein VHB77_21830 [Planctomycetaceae bacterium]|nr:hypothetical protein [Planctomycetaceae bacterium]
MTVLLPRAALADGGTVRLVEERDGCRISVFTSPTPCRVGVVDVSVMVQDSHMGRVLPETRIEIVAAPRAHPSRARRYLASAQLATNKLFQSAAIEFPAAGVWTIDVRAAGPQGTADVQCELEVARPLPRWQALWHWIAWPGAVVALFALRSCVQADRSRSKRATTNRSAEIARS